ncbi:MAG: 2-thiouracil desulfurase family protein [Desulfovibrionales bacterium]
MDCILISACLLGEPTRFDGRSFDPDPLVLEWKRQGIVIPCCPEMAGGLPVPRPQAEIRGGSGPDVLAGRAAVRSLTGEDLSEPFRAGARVCLEIARTRRVSFALLKEGSPSCGSGVISDGSFSGRKRAGSGVTAALLGQNNVRVFSELELPRLAKAMELKKQAVKDLCRLDGIGARLSRDLWDLGIEGVADLRGRDPQHLYTRLERMRGKHLDRCVLYVFRCAVYQAENDLPEAGLTKWWNWSDDNLERNNRNQKGKDNGQTYA